MKKLELRLSYFIFGMTDTAWLATVIGWQRARVNVRVLVVEVVKGIPVGEDAGI